MVKGHAEPVEAFGSFARRVGGEVRLQLQLPAGVELGEPTLMLRARGGKDRVETPAVVSPAARGLLVTASVPSTDLRPGLWRLWLRPDQHARFRRLEARLLYQHKQPIALLAGPVPDTEMAPPRRKSAPVQPTRPGRGRRVAGVAVDKVLRWLPEERASRYRRAITKVARGRVRR